MNTEKHLILVKGEDKTEKIKWCAYENGKWQVTFESGKTYSYGYHNVKWLKNPKLLNLDTTVVYENGQPISGVNNILDFGEYIRICFVTGRKRVYDRQEISIEQSNLKNTDDHNCFKYLKQLAAKISVKDEDDNSFLSRQYANLTFFRPKSVFAKYSYPTTLIILGLCHAPYFLLDLI